MSIHMTPLLLYLLEVVHEDTFLVPSFISLKGGLLTLRTRRIVRFR